MTILQKKKILSATRDDRAALDRAIGRGFSVFRTPEALNAWQWADRHFYLSPESSAIEGPWETLSYQRAILSAMMADDIPEVNLLKPKRIGYTKLLTAVIARYSAELRRSGVVYQPVDSDAAGYTRDEIDTMLRDCATVRAAMVADPERKGKHSTVESKSFLGATLHIRGGKSPRAYRRLTKDYVIYDELDGFDRDIGGEDGKGEGSPLKLGDGRIEASPFKKSIRGSTPGLKGVSLLETEVENSDLIFERYVRCWACDELHLIEFDRFEFDRSAPIPEVEAFHVCPVCEYRADYSELAVMDAQGEWRTRDGLYRLTDDGDIVDTMTGQFARVTSIAMKLWAGYSYFRTWSSIAQEFIKASAAAKRGDVTLLKAFVMTTLARFWEEKGLSARAEDTSGKRESYDGETLPAEVLRLTAGVDRQHNRLEAELVGWGVGEESWGVEAVKFWGDPNQPEVWEKLDAWLLLTRRTIDGRTLRVSACAVDSSDQPNSVYRFCDGKWHRRIFAVKGRDVEKGRPIISGEPTIIKRRPGSKNSARGGCRLFILGTHAAKTLLFNRLNVEEPGPGYCHFSTDYSDEFFKQYEAEKLIVKRRRGRDVGQWEQVARRNEAVDLRQYAIAALYVLGPTSRTLRPRDKEEPAKPTSAEAALATPPSPPLRPRRIRRQRTTGLSRNWRG